MLEVFWDFEAILVLQCGTIVGTELGLINHAEKLLLSFGNRLELFLCVLL
jgi:hypothetical protein